MDYKQWAATHQNFTRSARGFAFILGLAIALPLHLAWVKTIPLYIGINAVVGSGVPYLAWWLSGRKTPAQAVTADREEQFARTSDDTVSLAETPQMENSMTVDAFIEAMRAGHMGGYVRREDQYTPRGEGDTEIWKLPSGEWAYSKLTRSSRVTHTFATEQELLDELVANLYPSELKFLEEHLPRKK